MQELSDLLVLFFLIILKMAITAANYNLAVQVPLVVFGGSWALPKGVCTSDPSVNVSLGD